MEYEEACKVWDILSPEDKEYYCNQAGIDTKYADEDSPPYEVIEFLVMY